MFDDRLFVVSAQAPFPFEYGGYTWYGLGNSVVPEDMSFRESCNRLHQFLLDVRTGYAVDPSRIFLFGFSMGCVMSYAMALTEPGLVRGVSANSGYVPEGSHLQFQWNALQSVSFFITHGTHDSVLPVALGRRAEQLFRSSNANFSYREYPADHQLTEEGLADVVEWMRPLIA
jgi:phospholipase/carboxylesterase